MNRTLKLCALLIDDLVKIENKSKVARPYTYNLMVNEVCSRYSCILYWNNIVNVSQDVNWDLNCKCILYN